MIHLNPTLDHNTDPLFSSGNSQAGTIGEYLYFDKIYDESGDLKIDVNNSTYYVKEVRSETGSVLWNTSAGDFPVSGSSIVIVNSNTPWASLQKGETAAYWSNGSQLANGDSKKVISWAIENTTGIIKLLEGTYSLSGLDISNQVTLTGEGDATIIQHNGESSRTIEIGSDNVVLKDLKIIGGSRSSDTGISSEGHHFKISGVTVTNYHWGIKVSNPQNSTISNCRISAIGSDGEGDGIHARNAENKLVIRDTFAEDCAGSNYNLNNTTLDSNWCYLCAP